MLDGLVSLDFTSRGYSFPLLPQLTRAYVALGHSVSLVTTGMDIHEVEHKAGPHLDVYVVPARPRAAERAGDLFQSERKLISEVLQAARADVVHAHWTYEFAWAAQELHSEQTLVTAHDAPLTVLRAMPDAYRLARAAMAYRVRMHLGPLTAVSRYLAARWRKEMAYRKHIEVISNPVVIGGSFPRKDSDAKIILDIADQSRRKNVYTLIRAFRLVKAQYPAAILRLVGPGLDAWGQLATRAHQEKMREGVQFLGVLDRRGVERELASASVFVHTSKEESQGIALLEAMAMRVPIVAGRASGAVPDTLRGGAFGSLVDVTCPRAIAAEILHIIRDPGASNDRTDSAHEYVRTKHSATRIAEEYLSMYERM